VPGREKVFGLLIKVEGELCSLNSDSEEGSGSGSDSDSEEGFTVHLCRETLYMDHWYSITFKNDDRAPTPTPTPPA
jgi:hypothetical protein